MIQSLLIGNNPDLERYSNLLSKSKYFGKSQTLNIEGDEVQPNVVDYNSFDALFVVSPIKEAFSYFDNFFKLQKKMYFVDQPGLSGQELIKLEKVQRESDNLVFTEKLELEHPLVDEFLTTSGSYLLFHYTKSISGKRNLRTSLFSALCFLSVLSPMQVKKIDLNTIDTTPDGKPTLKIRLKMLDSSLCYVSLKFDNQMENSMYLETKAGSFFFNFSENYLENVHGKRFTSSAIEGDGLLLKSIESFAVHIIMNTKPKFTFRNYIQVINTLCRIEAVLPNSF